MRGGGTLLRDLGLFPKDLYNDTVDYLTNVKTYTGDNKIVPVTY